MSNEDEAIKIGNSRISLLGRLKEARQCLRREYLERFPLKGSVFDFDNRRLINPDKSLVLQWRLRYRPDMPISYENQQTTRGSVFLYET